jgi:tryptophan synthase alpha chain
MNAIDATFARLRSDGRKAFIPFITAGDPDLQATARVLQELARSGADIIEIGFPYSDPIADGPVIQASYTRALGKKIRTAEIFQALGDIGVPQLRDGRIPLVAMTSFTLIQRRGPETFLSEAKRAGFGGIIVPDLPLEEATDLARLAAGMDLKLIQLITPATPRERAQRIVQLSTGFIYYVSVTGITGERDQLPEALIDQLCWLRDQTALPICVGFGISRPEQIEKLRKFVDGIIVGSALVRRFEEIGLKPAAIVAHEIGEQVRALAKALNPI